MINASLARVDAETQTMEDFQDAIGKINSQRNTGEMSKKETLSDIQAADDANNMSNITAQVKDLLD